MQTPGPLGSFDAHWASVVQGPQVRDVRLQIGFAVAVQSLSARHSTHAPASTSQTVDVEPSKPPPSKTQSSAFLHLYGPSPASLASRASPPSPASPASPASPPSRASPPSCASATPPSDGLHAFSVVLQLRLGQSLSIAQYFGF